MRSWLRVVGVVLSVLAGVGAAFFTAKTMRRPQTREDAPRVDRAAAMRAFELERAVAVAMGMAPSEEGDVPLTRQGALRGSWSTQVSMNARECVAVIATVHGHYALHALALQTASEDASRIVTGTAEPVTMTGADGGLVAQVQWCEPDAAPRMAVLEANALTDRVFSQPLEATVHFAVYRANWNALGGPPRLRRGTPRSWPLRLFPAQYAVDEANGEIPAGGRMLGVAMPIHNESARLVPGNAETYAVLYRRVRGAAELTVNPRVDPSHPPGDTWGTGLPSNFLETYRALAGLNSSTPRVHDPVFEAGGRFRRVLAVVDTGALGARCVALMFTRMLYMHRASVWRHGPSPEDPGHELGAAENSAIDTRCPTAGVAAYSVDERDQEDWILRVFALPEPTSAPPRTSSPSETRLHRGRHRRHRAR